MYCRAYIHAPSEAVVSVLGRHFGTARREHSKCYFREFEIYIRKNDEYDQSRLHTYPDGFLYYETTAEIEIYDDYIRVTDDILRILWENGMPTVVSCDYEDELNRYIFGRNG